MNEANPPDIIVGVDTHKQTHVAVAITGLGARVAELTICANTRGYQDLEAWASSLGAIRAFARGGSGNSDRPIGGFSA